MDRSLRDGEAVAGRQLTAVAVAADGASAEGTDVHGRSSDALHGNSA
jgi:hypothetical protein